jgi:hypothetical protein
MPHTSIGAFVEVLMFPTLLTMFVSGMWHGAGYLFILWGLLHGLFLTVNHAWRLLGPKLWHDRASYTRFMQPVGFVLTFMCVVVSMVVFRSATWKSASCLFQGMLGLHGIALPNLIYDRLQPFGQLLHHAGVARGFDKGVDFKGTSFWILILGIFACARRNTLQLLGRYEPALGWKPNPDDIGTIGHPIVWNASVAWAAVVAVVGAIAVLHVGGGSEFLYWQF